MDYIFIENLDQLKKEAYRKTGDLVEFYIMYAGGLARSCKRITYRPESDDFYIIHEIDDSEQELKGHEIEEKTNFIEAMTKKAFILYDDDRTYNRE